MKTFWSIIVALSLLVCTFFVGRHTKPCPIPEERVDTLVIREVIRDSFPVYITRYVDRIVRDTTLEIVRDTITNEIYVNVPIEKTNYKNENYDLWIEGYRSRLLSIDVYKDTYYIDRVERYKVKPRWGIGVQVGYGYNFDKFYPYVGVGIQYNLFTW